MHIIRLDIDRKNSAEHLQVGPLGSGLNAVYAPVNSGSESMSRFVRNMLFRGYQPADSVTDDYTDNLDGSLQWVDASGHVRMMSYAGGSPLLPSRYVHSPLHPSERPLHSDDRDQIRGLGNIFWEGDETDSRWDDLRGDILGMVFCSPLGSVSPEKLWWAASRLGVHAPAKTEADEGYRRLKAEEQELQDRLRNVENVDHDRAWWSVERDRIAAELTHVQHINWNTPAPSRSDLDATVANPLRERHVSLQYEIARLRGLLQEAIVNEANAKLDRHRGDEYRAPAGTTIFKNVSQANSPATTKPVPSPIDFIGERARLQSRIESLVAEQAAVELELRNQAPVQPAPIHEPIRRWDDTQLKQQLAHAEEMLRRWDRRTQTHRRLAEVQSHLRTRSPYRRTTEGSLIPIAEKYLKELTSGAARQLPLWATEASYLDNRIPTDVNIHSETGYRSEYYDRAAPASNTRQRRIVDLAIRLAIAQAASPRIGRIPLLLDEAIGSFRGESLEQMLHVLAAFSRDGRQILISTSDEYTARRIAAHGGTVSRMQEIMRFARPNYVLDGQLDLGLHPALERSAIVAHAPDARPLQFIQADGYNYELGELNRQLAGLANEQAVNTWWYPDRQIAQPRFAEPISPVASSKRFYLYVDSPVQDAPGIDVELTHRLNHAGIFRVSDLLRASAVKLGTSIRVAPNALEHIQRVAELMCATPGLRAFDAQVLVGCGITRSSSLREFAASDLIHRIEDFLGSASGQDLIRTASSFEVSRLHGWISEMKRNHRLRSPYERNPFENSRKVRTPRPSRPLRSEHEPLAEYDDEIHPRIARTTDFDGQSPAQESFARAPRSESQRAARSSSTNTKSTSASGSQWKFYLDIESPVVDAPSIGPKMAEKLAPLGVLTVGDLIASDASELATQLAERAVTAETVLQWQQQSLLVCRVPNLRGHDAQLIVGTGLVTAEQVASADAASLHESVTRFANTKAGLRILRGASSPDLAEVADWIQWAHNCRAVRAA